MSIEQIYQTSTENSEQTEKLAEAIGANLRGGEVIELVSDLGGGKTTFTRGLARGMGSIDHVSSPTFKIMNEYKGKKLHLYHYDFYRLSDDRLIGHELNDALTDKEAAVVVEWGKNVGGALPPGRISIDIERTGDMSRRISIKFPDEQSHIIKGIK